MYMIYNVAASHPFTETQHVREYICIPGRVSSLLTPSDHFMYYVFNYSLLSQPWFEICICTWSCYPNVHVVHLSFYECSKCVNYQCKGMPLFSHYIVPAGEGRCQASTWQDTAECTHGYLQGASMSFAHLKAFNSWCKCITHHSTTERKILES